MLNVRGRCVARTQDIGCDTTKSRPAVSLPLVAEAETVIAQRSPRSGDVTARWYRLIGEVIVALSSIGRRKVRCP